MIRVLIPLLLFHSILLNAQDEVLIWSDEFNVDGAPNPAYWGYDLGNNGGWGNNEAESYTSSSTNVRVSNGLLIIDAIKSGSSWSSARIKSQNKFNFTYGHIKFSAKLPTGTGTWPALWLLGENITSKGWPACGEIDIMEHVGVSPGTIHSTLHTPSSYGNSVNTKTKNISTYSSAFHDYEMIWTPDKIQFLIDGISFYTYQPSNKTSSTWPFNTPFFIIMNLAMGGNFGGSIDPSLTSAELQVDYVRVYQSMSTFNINGPSVVHNNDKNLSYSFNNFAGATYNWSVPADAVITSGQGTNKITVDWGSTDGNIDLSITVGSTYQKSLSVTHAFVPDTTFYAISLPGFWANNKDNPNVYKIISQSPLRVNYTVAQKISAPSLIGTLSPAVDLTTVPIMKVRAKLYNISQTMNFRLDLVDINGVSTTKAPIFEMTPLIDDGEYFTYTFDFKNKNKWLSTTGAVDPSRISKINLFLDYGIGAVNGYDSLWMDSLWFEATPTDLQVPSRPSNLGGSRNGQVTLTWHDNSDTETGFDILGSSNIGGPYSTITSVSANTTSVTFTPTFTFFIVRSVNAAGSSEPSNTISITEVVTGVEDQPLQLSIYPNPTQGLIHVETDAVPAKVRCVDMLGRELLKFELLSKKTDLDLRSLPAATYVLHVISKNKTSSRKVTLK